MNHTELELIASDYRKAAKDCKSRGLTHAQEEYSRLAFMADATAAISRPLPIEIVWEDT